MPITTINGGISAFRILILKPNNWMVAKLQTTPMQDHRQGKPHGAKRAEK